MYSIYEAESWPIATDAYSAVQRMRCQFTALAFETDHETVYGLGRRHSEAYLQYLVIDMDELITCPYDLSHKLLRRRMYKHKIKSHKEQYLKDLYREYREKLGNQEAIVDNVTLKNLTSIQIAVGPIDYWTE
ncbi:hypothetical protein FQA39_LY14411 [Lamprigera yunnana]|nr:hypothetical protein FQA39_LY14411 [Lamprigera yunnana]